MVFVPVVSIYLLIVTLVAGMQKAEEHFVSLHFTVTLILLGVTDLQAAT